LAWDTLYDSGQDDWGKDVCIGDDGSVFVAGTTGSADKGTDFLTVKFKPE